MNKEAQERLNYILALEPEALSEADLEFLRARSLYLTEEQVIRFGLANASAAAPQEEIPRARRGRKASETIEQH